jgi:hypothetical protein
MHVQRFEKAGRLHPRRAGHRVWFSIEEVTKLASEWQPTQTRAARIDAKLAAQNIRGEIAAKVFPMLRAGSTLEEIVIATKADPLLVRELRQEWRMSFEDGEREARKREHAAREREDQLRHDRRLDMAEWRKVKLEEIRLAAEIARAGGNKKEAS